MVCIVCLAIMAAAGFAVGAAIGESIDKKLAGLIESGRLVHESESVGTWEGKLTAWLSDGSRKTVRVTIRIFKDSGRVMIQIHDHSLSQAEAEALEDEIAEALGAQILERRFPPVDENGIPVCDHEHDDEGMHVHEEEAEELLDDAEGQPDRIERPAHRR